jgi:hypothetical protein
MKKFSKDTKENLEVLSATFFLPLFWRKIKKYI